MANTPKLNLPEISVSQSQKETTANETFRGVDALCQCTIIDKDLAEPPGAPSDGDTYIVGATPSSGSDWTGHENDIAYYSSSSWVFYTPLEGWRVWVQQLNGVPESQAYVFKGASDGWALETDELVGDFTGLDDTPSAYSSGDGGKIVAVNDAETALEFKEWNAYDVGGSYVGVPPVNEDITRIPFVRSVDYPDDFSGSQFKAGVAATAEAVFTIKVDAVQVGTITIAAAATTGTFATDSAALTITAGEVLTVEAPASQDATLADFGFLLKGSKS